VRYALICAHYREHLNFTFDGLQAARSALQRIDEFLLKLQELGGTRSVASAAVDSLCMQFESALDDDLNISSALGVLFDFIRDANKRMTDGALAPQEAQCILAAWERFDAVLGLGMPTKLETPAEIQRLVEERQAARKSKNFKRSDEIRDQLSKLGWVVDDTPKGPRAKPAM
jgi:cysteinyl-tRNA synthetase